MWHNKYEKRQWIIFIKSICNWRSISRKYNVFKVTLEMLGVRWAGRIFWSWWTGLWHNLLWYLHKCILISKLVMLCALITYSFFFFLYFFFFFFCYLKRKMCLPTPKQKQIVQIVHTQTIQIVLNEDSKKIPER